LASGSVSKISLAIYSAIGEGNPAITGNLPVVVASHTLNTSFSGAQVIQVALPTPASILPNTTYYLEFSGGAGDSGFFGGTTTNLYSGGLAITNPNRSGFTEFANFDFYFETLTDTNFVAVPEPSVLPIGAVLMLGAVLPRRRRKDVI
jgi:hypothetical protein